MAQNHGGSEEGRTRLDSGSVSISRQLEIGKSGPTDRHGIPCPEGAGPNSRFEGVAERPFQFSPAGARELRRRRK